MTDRNQKEERDQIHGSDQALGSKGKQGVDKAPGEDPAGSIEHADHDSQKGKTKVDADPSKETEGRVRRGNE